MDVVRALVGVHHLEVDQVAATPNSSTMPLPPSMSRAMRAMSSALPQELRFMIEVISTAAVPSSFMRPEPQAALQAERDLGLHVGQLLLDQLVGGERPAELLAVEHVLARAVPAVLGGAERAPGDAVARASSGR